MFLGGKMDKSGKMSSPTSEEDDLDNQTVKSQSQIFEQMRDLLKTQQASLKQNIQMLQAKTSKINKNTRNPDPRNARRTNDISKASCPDAGKMEEIDGIRQKSYSSAAKSRDAIQICPICAAEFDEPDHPEALEEHVAGHWCSSENPSQ